MLKVDKASIYYEIAGRGLPIVMIHAGVADSRQWNNEFRNFADRFQVIRYDLRGFGKSKPVEGEFNHLQDLTALLKHLDVDQPLIVIGCSMGGGLAMDFALEQQNRIRALILVDSAPSGLKLDIPMPDKFKLVEQADTAGDLDLVAEIETQIWFDGDRKPGDVNQQMRALAYEMNRIAVSHAATGLGKPLFNTKTAAVKRLHELRVPVLALIGANDIPYMHATLDYMAREISNIRTAIIENAAHLPNMDQPDEFENIVMNFIGDLPVIPVDPQ